MAGPFENKVHITMKGALRHGIKQGGGGKALTDRINDRQMYMKGIDASYRYEGYSTYKTEDLKKAIPDRDVKERER